MTKKILKHLRATAIGLAMMTACGVIMLAVALPLVWIGNYYPYIIAGGLLLAASWAIGMCYPAK